MNLHVSLKVSFAVWIEAFIRTSGCQYFALNTLQLWPTFAQNQWEQI